MTIQHHYVDAILADIDVARKEYKEKSGMDAHEFFRKLREEEKRTMKC